MGLNRRFATGTSFSFTYRNHTSEDRFPEPAFDSDERVYRLSASQSLRRLNISTSCGYGEKTDNLTSQNSTLEVGNISASFSPTNRQSYSGYLYYRNDTDFTGENRRSMTAGLNSSYRIDNNTHFAIRFRTNEYRYSEHTSRSRNIEAQLNHTFRNEHKISMRCRHTSFVDSHKNALMVEYAVPLALPVGRKKNTGTVKGYVYNDLSKKPIPDAILRFNGSIAVTDEDGSFTFPFLKQGIHYLDINTARLGMNLVTVQKTPMEVNVEGGKDTFVQIGITQGATISGRVMVYNFEERGYYDNIENKEKLIESYGLANAIVEISDGVEIKRRLTDEKGCFSFEELCPRKWTFKIYDYDLPEYHYLEKDTFEIELKPGGKEEVLIRVLPKKRRIRIIGVIGEVKTI